MTRSLISLLLSLSCLSACGDEPVFIVESMRMRIYFEERAAELEFRFNSEYESKFESAQLFPGLSYVEVKRNEPQSLYLYSLIDPEELNKDWPFSRLEKLPSGDKLPDPLRNSWIYEWREENLSLLVQESGPLILGASFQDKDFSRLPEGFLAVQYIRSKGGELKASIAVYGPSENQYGGVLTLGHFGSNPFGGTEGDIAEYYASEPAQILSWGKSSRLRKMFEFFSF